MESNSTSLKIFINWVDTYTGYNLSRHLYNSRNPDANVVSDIEPDADVTDEFLRRSIKFEIYGTVKSTNTTKSMGHIYKVLNRFNQMELIECFNSCDVVIFDISDDPEQIDEAKFALHGKNADIRPSEEEEEIDVSVVVLPFTEDDYRRRKPHPNYKRHWLFEKDVIRIGRFKPEALKTYVISSGLKYGMGEDILFHYFKTAWMNASFLPCIGNGKNKIPLIYITDLALLLQNLIEKNGTSPMYILAVDGQTTHLDSIVKAISEKLTTGAMRRISLENALLINGLKSRHLDYLTCDLLMESTIMTYLSFEGGLLPHISKVIQEFKETHGLEPIRIFIHGPPGAGQKQISENIASYYKVHPLFVKDVIQEKILKLKKIAVSESDLLKNVNLEEEAEEEEEENEVEDESTAGDESDEDEAVVSLRILQAQEYLKSLKESLEKNNGELEDKLILNIVQEKLASKPCQNQGFALYGYPETSFQAKDLFTNLTEIEEVFGLGVVIMPELVVNLDAPDSFLKEKLILLPEVELVEQYGSEEALFHKLSEFRRLNTSDDSILSFFDEQETRIEIIDISTVESNKVILDRVKRLLGSPRNFGLSPEETEKQLRMKAEQTLKDQIAAKLNAEEEERQESHRKLAEVRIQEEQMLEAQSLPMRNYLMQHVLPVLSHGLLECVKIRPQDPINFLAEYLFKFTPVEFPTPSTNKHVDS
uniref:Adenylate kinase 7 n=1 Tax=Strigamia maritima TaxID=126957 RepID=T1JG49_STRMM